MHLIKRATRIGSIVAILLLTPFFASAHENMESGKAAACLETIPIEDVSVPNLTETRWSIVSTLTIGRIRYVFYSDKQQPQVPIAAVTAEGEDDSGVTHIRITWQTGGLKRTFRPLYDTMVCQRPIVGDDGNPYDLNGLKNLLMRHFFSKS